MTLLKHFWHWINPTLHTHLLVLELDSTHAGYLTQLADSAAAPRQEVAQDLLKAALVDRQIADTHLTQWRALTNRQQQVAALACLNFTNRQIAARLKLSPQTVKSHMRNLLNRFNLHSKNELREALADWDFSAWV